MAEPTFYASVNASVAGASKKHLALWNAVGSGKTLKVYRISATGQPTVAVTGLIIALLAFKITAAPTGGSIVTPLPFGTDVLPANITSMAGATAGATEAAIPFGSATVSGEETSPGDEEDLYKFDITGMKTLEVPEGSGVVVRQGLLASAGAVTVIIYFSVV